MPAVFKVHTSFAVVILVFICGFAQASDADSAEQRLAAAKQLLAVEPLEPRLVSALEIGARRYPALYPAELREKVIKRLRQTDFESKYLVVLTRTFTTAELIALGRFWSTPEGKSASQKMATFVTELSGLVDAELGAAIAFVERAPTKEGIKFAARAIELLSSAIPRIQAAITTSDFKQIDQFGRAASQFLVESGFYSAAPGPTKQFPECADAVKRVSDLLSLASASDRAAVSELFFDRASSHLKACKVAAGSE
jgi:hypothetical protein